VIVELTDTPAAFGERDRQRLGAVAGLLAERL
jgi:hypothetical protein